MGLPAGTFNWAGPFDPIADPGWQAVQEGRLKERDYWDERARVFADLTGEPAQMPRMMAHLYDGSPEEVTRDGARALMADVKAAGIPLGLLTNDMHAFHTQQWIATMQPVLSQFDVIVDGSVDGVMKPDPRAFELVCERMGISPEGTVFIDDLRSNLEGAVSVGMIGVFLDVTDTQPAFDEVRLHLGLTPSSLGDSPLH
ncbi:MAG: HAD-IA family hydrolase [Actinobacteria bacterium]|nr:HAD-IA family hydrolase [Actinomycetota bacterium]